jgi:predicted dehydrogenase
MVSHAATCRSGRVGVSSRGRIRTAVVGYGLGGEVFHAPLVAAARDLVLSSIVTANADRAARARARYPDVRVLPDVDALWAAAAVHDLVVISTPNRFHVPIALAALDAGLHVVVDKPLAPTASEARRLLDAADGSGLVCTVFQNRRLDGDFLTVRRLISEGALGRVHRFESRFERWRPDVEVGAWRELGDPEEGGGVLLDLGSHLVDQAVQLFGPPEQVYGEVGRRRSGAEADDDAFVALHHRGGAVSHLWMSLVAGALGPRYRVLGDAGAYEKHGLDPQEDQLSAGVMPGEPGYGAEPADRWGSLVRGDRTDRVPTERGHYPAFYADVTDAIRGHRTPAVSLAQAVAVLEILETARASRPRQTGRTG